MPELPEVETVCRGISPHTVGQVITNVVVRDRRLRWPIPEGLETTLQGLSINRIERRAKYLLLHFDASYLIIHLGMSGRLYLVKTGTAPEKHAHLDIDLNSGQSLRFTDPRRFGCVLWQQGKETTHKLLAKLGPEPLGEEFNGDYLYQKSRKRQVPIKTFLMNNHIVVGVGNIYANEALFIAGIRPTKPASKLSKAKAELLVSAIKQVLAKAIAQGGTTLKDFVGGDGKPGYFAQELEVYGRVGLPCNQCGKELNEIRMNNRSTVFCTICQK